MAPNSSDESNEQKKAQVQAYFSRTAANYVTSASHRTGSDLQRLVALGEWKPSLRAIDIATGGGHTALAVAPHVAEIMVTDLTPTMLQQARAFLLEQGVTNAHFQIADAEHLPFEDASFERATCRIAPHHFPNVTQAISEVARVLTPGGLFLLIDSCAPTDPELDIFDNTIEKWRDDSHGRSYNRLEWNAFLEGAGLLVERQEIFRRTHQYQDWTARSQMPEAEKQKLEDYILNSTPAIQHYFEVIRGADDRLKSLSMDFILLKGRKPKV
ncbi:methyltransferase [Dictyobacter sp. S3.2.2.5]|uniref:Methyltransferase n=1 Tax=Dictyobacter halimunensis TaxID=3026934 RepID=A0ABQ6FV09_9CHLR|nr:methyltransferase [Dictyobacter sp. S3.2.2.5]